MFSFNQNPVEFFLSQLRELPKNPEDVFKIFLGQFRAHPLFNLFASQKGMTDPYFLAVQNWWQETGQAFLNLKNIEDLPNFCKAADARYQLLFQDEAVAKAYAALLMKWITKQP